ncbi:MAG: two-component regulator propeller domain-containing protein [Rhodanobacteraceae bacterium]
MLPALLLATALSAQAAVIVPREAPPSAPTFRHYGAIDGLPSDAVYTLAQDRAGYVWVGTRDGLARFDAHDFRIFRHDPADPASLPANDVSALLVDAQGRVWAGGEGNGLDLYRSEDGGFTSWRHDPRNAPSLSGNDVLALAQTSDGSIWVGVYAGGLNRLAPNMQGFTHLRHRDSDPASLLSDSVTALAAANDGGLWIGGDAGLQYRDAHGRLTRIVLPGVDAPTSVWQLRQDADGVDAATDAGVFHVDTNGRAQRIGANVAAFASLRDAHGYLWIARQRGVDLISSQGVRLYAPLAGVPGSLPGALPLGLLADREGSIWIALLDGGVAYLPPSWRAFDAWQHVPGDASSLASDRVRTIAGAHDGTLWVGGTGGLLDRLDPRDGRVRHFENLTDKVAVTALAEGADGRLWIGRHDDLRVFDGERVQVVGAGLSILHRGVVALLAARDGSIYFSGVGSGVARVDPRTLHVQTLSTSASGHEAKEVIYLREADDGSIWSAGAAGLARLDRNGETFDFIPGIARGSVDAFVFGRDRTVWIARGGRLQHFRLQSGVAKLLADFGPEQGSPSVYVDALEVDAAGRVWASTPRGMFRCDPATSRIDAYAAADGLANAEFVPRALLRTGDGTLYAGSLGGVIGIRPGSLPISRPAPQVALDALDVRRDGRVFALDPRAPIALRWDDRELTATAHALSFADPQHDHYRFRLAGFDPDWVDTGARNVREFSSLRNGDYRLQVGAANGDGVWSVASAPIRIHVAAPPWATPWAWAVYVLAAILSLAYAVWILRRRLEQQNRFALAAQHRRMAEQASAAKTQFLATMAHEIRTPMTGVLGMTELLFGTPLDARQRGFADGIRRSGALLMRQVNDALDLARIEADKFELSKAPFDPAALLHEIVGLERGLAEQQSLALDVEIAPEAPHGLLGDALRVQQVLLNLVHNALKFTQRGGVRLGFARGNTGVVFTVADSGAGMTREECTRLFRRYEQTDHGKRAGGSGLGLTISGELVALMGGRIEVESEPGRGSTFRVHLPLPECEMAGDNTALPGARDRSVENGDAMQRALHGFRVLLVEDDPVAAQVITGLLEMQAHSATHAPHALAALAELEATREDFNAILLDLDLPGMDGCALARLLRARGHDKPIIAITAGARGDEEQHARDAGMDGFLRKPILPEHLREALASLKRD